MMSMTLSMTTGEAWPSVRTRCNTIGCRELATTLVEMAEKKEPADTWTEQLCDDCTASYSRTPALLVRAL